jgi:hypothetical protein
MQDAPQSTAYFCYHTAWNSIALTLPCWAVVVSCDMPIIGGPLRCILRCNTTLQARSERRAPGILNKRAGVHYQSENNSFVLTWKYINRSGWYSLLKRGYQLIKRINIRHQEHTELKIKMRFVMDMPINSVVRNMGQLISELAHPSCIRRTINLSSIQQE